MNETQTKLSNNAQSKNFPILAKDRHYLHRLTQQIKQLEKSGQTASDDYQARVRKYQKLLATSQAHVQARMDSVPVVHLNEDLPVSQQADTLIQAIKDHQVIIVAGETGSGKTTQLPKIALLAGRGVTGQIGHTQPRRLAARSVANRIAEELGEPLGQTVSFKVRFTEQGTPNSLIKLMTDGILLAELAHDKFLSKYDTIIIDEAHERSLNIDFIMGYLKTLLPKRPDLKVIITSATLDTARFSKYFAMPSPFPHPNPLPKGEGVPPTLGGRLGGGRNREKIPAPVFNVEGRSYPVEVRYRPLTDTPVTSSDDDEFDEFEENLPRAITSAVEECYADATEKGHADQADILIFAATEAEIRDIEDVLKTYAPRHTQILPLFARQTFAEQQHIFNPTGGRRIIIATNVAETALTVPNIRYVIDLGFARISRYAYRSRVQRLPIEAISQAAANQRKGRCGRIAPGVCIRLYSEEDFNSRPAFTEPEILRTNLASVILQMANLGLGDVENFDFIEAPDGRLINDGRKLLEELGALSNKKTFALSVSKGNVFDGSTLRSATSCEATLLTPRTKTSKNRPNETQNPLTKIGQMMAKMPIDPRLARMLIAGEQFGCLKEMLVIVSALSVQDPRERPQDKQTQADQKHALFRQPNSDFLFYISLWQALYGSLFNDKFSEKSAEKMTDSLTKNKTKPLKNKDEKAENELIVAPSPYQTQDGETLKLTNAQRKSFAKKHFLSPPRLREWQQTHSQLAQMIGELKLPINQEPASFAHIHRALLTGLLSFIAHKVNDVDNSGKVIKAKRGEYLVARQNKAKIFPASTLFKQNPDWVMAFEIVETSQVFMRTLAKIEPEWILAGAGDLVKYHYFEPHWSAKTGYVKAYAQISLFGLIVVHKQLMNYDKVNTDEAHDIFLRDALVLGNLYLGGKNPPFLQHNLDKIAGVTLMEEKFRRRDLLADEENLYQFYAERVPKHIASRKSFEDWRAEVEKADDKFLYFSDKDVLNETAPSQSDKQFPESWQLGTLKLPLNYTFDPASDDDGVTIKVPLVALPQLDAIEVLWGIAGWRYELVLQLLKTLPKEIRRQIVPVPDTAQAIFTELEQQHHSGLLRQLCEALTRRGVTGINYQPVEPKDFNPQAVDRYLQPQIALVDEKNRLIEKGRDINALKLRHNVTTSQAVSSSKGLHETFPEHFKFIQSRHTAGVAIQQFSALVKDEVDEKNKNALINSVVIHQFTDLNVAIATHRQGVLTLIKNELGAKAKQLTSQIDKGFKLAFAPLGDLEALKTIVIDATLDATFEKFAPDFDHSHLPLGQIDKETQILVDSVPLNEAEFTTVKSAVLENFLSVGQTVLKQLAEVYSQWQQVRQKLLMLDREIFEESIEDIEDQLDDLHLAVFIYRMEYSDWQQYPRYLQALLIRLDRLEHGLDADLDAVYALDKHMERLATNGLGKGNLQGKKAKKLAEYRWLVEEYRIQLFAQPMKTRQAVSEKRLEKLWSEVNN